MDPLVPNDSYFPDDPECANEPPFVPYALDIPRTTALFYILAGVKKGSYACSNSFFVPISLPRGLPADVTALARRWHDAWGDVFAVSWLTLAEIDAFDWNPVGCEWFREMLVFYEAFDEVRFVFWFDE